MIHTIAMTWSEVPERASKMFQCGSGFVEHSLTVYTFTLPTIDNCCNLTYIDLYIRIIMYLCVIYCNLIICILYTLIYITWYQHLQTYTHVFLILSWMNKVIRRLHSWTVGSFHLAERMDKYEKTSVWSHKFSQCFMVTK
jgi:hypothetical protein